MTINWKIILPIGIMVVFVFVLIGVNQFEKQSSQVPIVDNGQVQETPIALSQDLPIANVQPATGDIDETINDILATVSAEETYFADAIKDGELIAVDSQLINNFGQSYNENEF